MTLLDVGAAVVSSAAAAASAVCACLIRHSSTSLATCSLRLSGFNGTVYKAPSGCLVPPFL